MSHSEGQTYGFLRVACSAACDAHADAAKEDLILGPGSKSCRWLIRRGEVTQQEEEQEEQEEEEERRHGRWVRALSSGRGAGKLAGRAGALLLPILLSLLLLPGSMFEIKNCFCGFVNLLCG